MNPVLARELKERMRSPRATLILVVYLALLAAILYLTYRLGLLSLRNQMFGGGFTPASLGAASIGRLMFEVLLIFLLGLVAFIAPGASTGAIAGERERGTLQLLQVTLLRPSAIVLGKLAASLGFVLLLLVASLPLFTVALILGGVTPGQAFRGLSVIVALAVFLAALGTFLSSIARRTLHATIGTYALTFVLLFGTIITYGAERIARSSGGFSITDRPVSTYLNPFAALADAVVDPSAAPGFITSPLTMARQMIPSFVPINGGFSGPAEVIAEGEEDGRSWQLTARHDGISGLCVGLQESNGGSESCGMAGDEQLISVGSSVTGDAGVILFGPVTRDARLIRVDLVEGDPVEVKPFTEQAEDAGFEDTSFFVAALDEDQEPESVTVVGEDDEELVTQPVLDLPGARGEVRARPPMPDLPVPMPLPADLVPPTPAITSSVIGQAAVARPPVPADADSTPAPPEPTVLAPEDILPPPGVRVEGIPVPRPIGGVVGPAILVPEQQQADLNEPLPVWAVHTWILLIASVVLVWLGSRQLRRPVSKVRVSRKAQA
jgi:ABC-2 type transport system permease protein